MNMSACGDLFYGLYDNFTRKISLARFMLKLIFIENDMFVIMMFVCQQFVVLLVSFELNYYRLV